MCQAEDDPGAQAHVILPAVDAIWKQREQVVGVDEAQCKMARQLQVQAAAH